MKRRNSARSRIHTKRFQRTRKYSRRVGSVIGMTLVHEVLQCEGLKRTGIKRQVQRNNGRGRNAERERECPFRNHTVLHSLHINQHNLTCNLGLRKLNQIVNSCKARLIHKANRVCQRSGVTRIFRSNLQIPRVGTMQLRRYCKASRQYFGSTNIARNRYIYFLNAEVIHKEHVLLIRLRNESNMLTCTRITGKGNVEMLELQSVVNLYGLDYLECTKIVRIGHDTHREFSSILG